MHKFWSIYIYIYIYIYIENYGGFIFDLLDKVLLSRASFLVILLTILYIILCWEIRERNTGEISQERELSQIHTRE